MFDRIAVSVGARIVADDKCDAVSCLRRYSVRRRRPEGRFSEGLGRRGRSPTCGYACEEGRSLCTPISASWLRRGHVQCGVPCRDGGPVPTAHACVSRLVRHVVGPISRAEASGSAPSVADLCRNMGDYRSAASEATCLVASRFVGGSPLHIQPSHQAHCEFATDT